MCSAAKFVLALGINFPTCFGSKRLINYFRHYDITGGLKLDSNSHEHGTSKIIGLRSFIFQGLFYMTTQYSHRSKEYLWHFYNSNFFSLLASSLLILGTQAGQWGMEQSLVSVWLPQASPSSLVRLGSIFKFSRGNNCSSQQGMQSFARNFNRIHDSEGSEGELRLAHQVLGLITHSLGGARGLGL